MCGIVGAVSERDVQGILLEGLRRLEYRGYDSAGMAVVNGGNQTQRAREVGKVAALADAVAAKGLLLARSKVPSGVNIFYHRLQGCCIL